MLDGVVLPDVAGAWCPADSHWHGDALPQLSGDSGHVTVVSPPPDAPPDLVSVRARAEARRRLTRG